MRRIVLYNIGAYYKINYVIMLLLLAPTEYKNRHDKVGQYLHWIICNHYRLSTLTNWFEHHPQPAVEEENVSIH